MRFFFSVSCSSFVKMGHWLELLIQWKLIVTVVFSIRSLHFIVKLFRHHLYTNWAFASTCTIFGTSNISFYNLQQLFTSTKEQSIYCSISPFHTLMFPCHRGSLFRLLQKNTGKLDPRRRVYMAIDIVSAVYLSIKFLEIAGQINAKYFL